MSLTETIIKNAKPIDKPRKLFDGGGLYLLVSPNQGKYWRLKYRFGGTEKTLSFGVYPSVTLADARNLRDEARTRLATGVDPGQVRKEERAVQRDEAARREVEIRFSMDSEGALSIRLGARRVHLNPSETAQLRTFLDATRAVVPKE
jgi:hypothetical protein